MVLEHDRKQLLKFVLGGDPHHVKLTEVSLTPEKQDTIRPYMHNTTLSRLWMCHFAIFDARVCRTIVA